MPDNTNLMHSIQIKLDRIFTFLEGAMYVTGEEKWKKPSLLLMAELMKAKTQWRLHLETDAKSF